MEKENIEGHKIPCCWCGEMLEQGDVKIFELGDSDYYCDQCFYKKKKGYDRPSDRPVYRNGVDGGTPCCECSYRMTTNQIMVHDGKNYCDWCYKTLIKNNENHIDVIRCTLCHKPFDKTGMKKVINNWWCNDCYDRYNYNGTTRHDTNPNQINIRTIKLPLEENKELFLRGFVEKHSNENLMSFDKLFRLPKAEQKNVRMIVAIHKNEILAIGGFLIMDNFATESWTVVHTEHRKNNLGTLMLETKLGIAKAEQLLAYNSTTAKANKSSLAMLKKAHFFEIETFTGIKRPMIRLVHLLSGVESANHLRKLEFAIGVELK